MTNLLERHKATIETMEKTLVENCGRKINMKLEQKKVIARLLENFDEQTRKEKANKAMMEGKLMEDTGLSNVGPYAKFGINLISAVMAGVVAEQLVSVQPLTHRTGEVRYLKYKYSNAKSGAAAGDIISSALEFNGGKFNYTSETVTGEAATVATDEFSGTVTWKPLQPGTLTLTASKDDGTVVGIFKDNGSGVFEKVSGTATILTTATADQNKIDYTTGAYALVLTDGHLGTVGAVEYDYITTETNPQVPEVETELAIMPVLARTRKLRTVYSFDAAFDMQGDYGFNMDEEAIAYFSAEIAHEIDGEIMNDLELMAASNSDVIAEWDPTAPSGVSQMDHDDSFWNNIVKGGNIIFNRVRRGRASFVIAGVDVCNTIETMRKFVPTGDTSIAGPHITGTINGIPVIKNPYYSGKEYVVGYKGASRLDSGYIYAPYMPVTAIKVQRDNALDTAIGFATAYGKCSLNAKLYVKGTIA